MRSVANQGISEPKGRVLELYLKTPLEVTIFFLKLKIISSSNSICYVHQAVKVDKVNYFHVLVNKKGRITIFGHRVSV